MSFRTDGSRMVGSDEDAIFSLGLEGCVQRGHDVPINLFQGLNLGLDVTFVRCLVGRFHMNTNNVSIR